MRRWRGYDCHDVLDVVMIGGPAIMRLETTAGLSSRQGRLSADGCKAV